MTKNPAIKMRKARRKKISLATKRMKGKLLHWHFKIGFIKSNKLIDKLLKSIDTHLFLTLTYILLNDIISKTSLIYNNFFFVSATNLNLDRRTIKVTFFNRTTKEKEKNVYKIVLLYVIILHMFLLYKTRKCVSVEEKQANESGLYT